MTDYVNRQHLLRPVRSGVPILATPYGMGCPMLCQISLSIWLLWAVKNGRTIGHFQWGGGFIFCEIELLAKSCWQETGSGCKTTFNRGVFLQRSLGWSDFYSWTHSKFVNSKSVNSQRFSPGPQRRGPCRLGWGSIFLWPRSWRRPVRMDQDNFVTVTFCDYSDLKLSIGIWRRLQDRCYWYQSRL